MATENLRRQPALPLLLLGIDDALDFDDALDVDRSAFRLMVATDDGQHVVRVTGDLDLATRDDLYCACIHNGDQSMVVVDMSGVTFMDCAGYSALVAAARVLHYHGGSLTLRNPSGQAERLLGLLADLGSPDAPVDPDCRWNRLARFAA